MSSLSVWLPYIGLSFIACSGLLFYLQRRRTAHRQTIAVRACTGRLQAFFEATPDAMLISDANGSIAMANRQASQLLGYAIPELVGRPIEDLIPLRWRGHHAGLRTKFATTPGARRMGDGLTTKALCKDGSECDVEISLSRIETDQGEFFASALRDITKRIQAEQRIKELAFFDQLTGLPNRTLLEDRLTQTITASGRNNQYGALMFIDLDHFMAVNYTMGHDVGDLQLKQVAVRLTHCVRECDSVARVGGDEFAIILTGLGGVEAEAATRTKLVAEKILEALNQPHQLGEVSQKSSASIGVTLFCGLTAGIDALFKQADLAKHRAKDAGRNTIRFFDTGMDAALFKRVALIKDLRHALLDEQFVLHYQAQVDGFGRVIGAEVLLRWQHPVRGMVPPMDFIPLAEETGVILPLGLWVLETACGQLEKWGRISSMAQLKLAVNVSALQFAKTDFVQQVIAVVQRTGANPACLKLELTESMLVGNLADIIEKMGQLKAQGIGFALDDFGTGYSSLAYLSRLPLNVLKIDKTFINEVVTNPDDAAIVKTIIDLARSLRLKVVAEGVETAAQRAFLANAGCDAYQGYLFSRPLPLAGFESLNFWPINLTK